MWVDMGRARNLFLWPLPSTRRPSVTFQRSYFVFYTLLPSSDIHSDIYSTEICLLLPCKSLNLNLFKVMAGFQTYKHKASSYIVGMKVPPSHFLLVLEVRYQGKKIGEVTEIMSCICLMVSQMTPFSYFVKLSKYCR